MTRPRLAGIICALIWLGAALYGAAPSAHADNETYLNELRAHGAPVYPWAEGNWIAAGHRMCNELRVGVPRDAVAAEVTQTDPAMFMDVLQHELCPETVR